MAGVPQRQCMKCPTAGARCGAAAAAGDLLGWQPVWRIHWMSTWLCGARQHLRGCCQLSLRAVAHLEAYPPAAHVAGAPCGALLLTQFVLHVGSAWMAGLLILAETMAAGVGAESGLEALPHSHLLHDRWMDPLCQLADWRMQRQMKTQERHVNEGLWRQQFRLRGSGCPWERSAGEHQRR